MFTVTHRIVIVVGIRYKNAIPISPLKDDFQVKGSTLTMKNTQETGKHKISCRVSGPLGSTKVSSDLYIVGKSYFVFSCCI